MGGTRAEPDGRVYLYEYNDKGLMTKGTYPNGRVSLYEYNDQGLRTKIYDLNGNTYPYCNALGVQGVYPDRCVYLYEYTFKHGQLIEMKCNGDVILEIPLFK